MYVGCVRIENPTGAPADTKITDAETGAPIRGVAKLELVAEGCQLPRVTLELDAGPFLWAGNPEVRGDLAAIASEMRAWESAARYHGHADPWSPVLKRWAARIETIIEGATGLTISPQADGGPG